MSNITPIGQSADGIEIPESAGSQLKTIAFYDMKGGKRRVQFELPLLGQPGVPMGITSAFTMFYDRLNGGYGMTDAQTASSWSFFIQSLADSYPDATRHLARLDEAQLSHVIERWVRESEGYDPKA